MIGSMIHLPEPNLLFAHNQRVEDPRDGLTLFGPLDQHSTFGVRPAVIGTKAGIARFWRWVETIQRPIDVHKRHHPPFPGFEAAFNVPFAAKAPLQIEVDERQLLDACHIDDPHQRVHKVVHLYTDPILQSRQAEDARADVWFVVVPDEVYARCRPQSIVPDAMRVSLPTHLSAGIAKRLLASPSMFDDLNDDVLPYRYEPHFRNQLKAVLLGAQIPTQVVRETTLAPLDFMNQWGKPQRSIGSASEVAWNLSTTAYYKTGARPWKVADVRNGVCYLGIVFKRNDTEADGRWSSCGAQMFLDSGDAVVFRGTGGPWYSESTKSYHLNEDAARNLTETAVEAYRSRVGSPPSELFIHGKARFGNDEWRGFQRGVPSSTKLVGVRIRPAEDLRLYRPGTRPVLRGMAYVRDNRTAFLWASGFIPRLWTYPGREVPKPLLVDICRGEADMSVVLKDVLALTKLNYNACAYGDGQPVTLKFADAVGEILTSGPVTGAPLPFRLYI